MRNNGFYEPLHYKDWQYPYDSRNASENPPTSQSEVGNSQTREAKPMAYNLPRLTQPEYLCLAEGMKIVDVAQWREQNGIAAKLRYVFVSYTSQHFPTKADQLYLHQVGQHAARDAEVEAYWLGCSCLGSTEQQKSDNVWRICDVVRGSFAVVVAVAKLPGSQQEPLTEWKNRVWTLPELLLSPGSEQLSVYIKSTALHPTLGDGSDNIKPSDFISRREFSRYSKDPVLFGQLTDHLEGSVILSPLQLTTIALKCLLNCGTTQYLEGDLSYSLMGFLRHRPNICRADSAFQAFARLSLANDSNSLLERLICFLPAHPRDPWYTFQDYWNASFWDIHPKTQICGIGENDTVVLDGARAANIRWKSFPRVLLRTNDTPKRKFARFLLTQCGPVFFMGLTLLISSLIYHLVMNENGNEVFKSLAITGYSLSAFAALIILTSPTLIIWLYLGKVWAAQPWLIGFEGYMSRPEIERQLFGADMNRLSWSTTGSSLSRHKYLQSQIYRGYCKGQDPSQYPEIKRRINPPGSSGKNNNTVGNKKIFTLVDTHTLTITLFSAMNPPVAAVACGEEGGMQRTLLCSWDWTTNTLHRETVLRTETRAYWKMNPVGRIKLGLQPRRPLENV